MKPQQKAAAELKALPDWRHGRTNPCVHYEIHINTFINVYLFMWDTLIFIYYEPYKCSLIVKYFSVYIL